ncbi:unnamed protein product, partial [Aureobasidium pullulans]
MKSIFFLLGLAAMSSAAALHPTDSQLVDIPEHAHSPDKTTTTGMKTQAFTTGSPSRMLRTAMSLV